jgi:hypothetical protein
MGVVDGVGEWSFEGVVEWVLDGWLLHPALRDVGLLGVGFRQEHGFLEWAFSLSAFASGVSGDVHEGYSSQLNNMQLFNAVLLEAANGLSSTHLGLT